MLEKDKLKGKCGSCEYRYYCGGCRARAYGYTGDYLAPDPGCIRNAPAQPTLVYRTVPELLLNRKTAETEELLIR